MAFVVPSEKVLGNWILNSDSHRNEHQKLSIHPYANRILGKSIALSVFPDTWFNKKTAPCQGRLYL